MATNIRCSIKKIYVSGCVLQPCRAARADLVPFIHPGSLGRVDLACLLVLLHPGYLSRYNVADKSVGSLIGTLHS